MIFILTADLETAGDEPFNSYYEQHTYGRFSDYPFDFKAGADYFINDKTTLTFTVNGLADNQRFLSTNRIQIFMTA